MTNIVSISNPVTDPLAFSATRAAADTTRVNRVNFWNPATNIIHFNKAPATAISLGNFRFLKDHWLDGGEYILGGTIREMFEPWLPTPEVEPLDATAVDAFYGMGPTLPGCLRTQFTTIIIFRPDTFWYEVTPNNWALSGLGAGLPTIFDDNVQRYGDKEP